MLSGWGAGADPFSVERLRIECLLCGATRIVERQQEGECGRCGYVGWAPSKALDEPARKALRERPLEARRLRAAG